VSKAFKGFEVMKEIMAKESSTDDNGVASFDYGIILGASSGARSRRR
jgi:hypothetical protein